MKFDSKKKVSGESPARLLGGNALIILISIFNFIKLHSLFLSNQKINLFQTENH